MTHTPGPWKVEFFGDLRITESTLPEMNSDIVHRDAWNPVAVANCRLMAAAPELLEALKGLLAGGGSEATAAARAAIEKAVGPNNKDEKP